MISNYEVTCNVCGKDYHSQVGELQMDSLKIVQFDGWLILFDQYGNNAYAAICPQCWEQIVECWKVKNG